MPSPTTVISRTAATAAGPGDRGSPLRGAVVQRDGRLDVALGALSWPRGAGHCVLSLS
jgi:hypothetical protein